MNSSEKIFVHADKTRDLYAMDHTECDKLLCRMKFLLFSNTEKNLEAQLLWLLKGKHRWNQHPIQSHQNLIKDGYDKAVLEPRVSPAFAITYFCNHCNIRFENTSKYVDTLTLFHSKNLNQRSLTPRWPLTPCLLRSHVWLYPRIIVSKSHDNASMYVDTVINFAKYHIHTYIYILHTYTYYIHTTYRMSDHIVSYWTQFRQDKKVLLNKHSLTLAEDLHYTSK